MTRVSLLAVGVLALGTACSISPVVNDPNVDGLQGRYHDCRRAAKDYCRDALATPQDEMGKCVAQATYKCVSGD